MSGLIGTIVAFIAASLAVLGLVPNQQSQPIPQPLKQHAVSEGTISVIGYDQGAVEGGQIILKKSDNPHFPRFLLADDHRDEITLCVDKSLPTIGPEHLYAIGIKNYAISPETDSNVWTCDSADIVNAVPYAGQ